MLPVNVFLFVHLGKPCCRNIMFSINASLFVRLVCFANISLFALIAVLKATAVMWTFHFLRKTNNSEKRKPR